MDISRRSFVQAGVAAASAAPIPAANDRIQVGVIGCGARSQELMRALQQIPAVELVGVVDAYKGRIERSLDRIGGAAKAYPSYKDLLAAPGIDAVVIATPDHWHKTMIVDAAGAGKDVYCEKPMTYNASEGVEIIEAARSAKRIVQIGSQVMSMPIQQEAREMIRSGKLGQVTIIRAAYNRNTASGAWIYPIPPDASPQTVNWDMFQGPAPKHAFDLERFFRWRCYRDYSGGIATDLFVHLCTNIHFLMGAKVPARVAAMGELYRWKESRNVPDTLNAILEYPEGFVVNLSSSFNNQTAAESYFQICGTEGTLSLDDGMTFYPQNAREDNRWIVESWPKRLEDAYYKDPKVRREELGEGQKAGVRAQARSLKGVGPDATVLHFQHWVDSIRSRKPYWEDAVAGHHAAACAHMVNLAAQEHRTVEWDFSRDDIKRA